MGLVNATIYPELHRHVGSLSGVHLRELFAEDGDRFARFSREACGIHLDYSKNLITQESFDALMELARSADVEGWRDKMFSGEKINFTEDRAVLHTALRADPESEVLVDGKSIVPDIQDVLRRMGDFSEQVRDGRWLGFSGKRIRYVVNIGIGGSDLGPVMVSEALKHYWHADIQLFYVSNVDGTHLAEVLKKITADEALFIIASKTFTTQETMMNARSAREWFLAAGAMETDIAKHFVALSTNSAGVQEFGIATENMFGFWDWVGGRYSVWGAIGLSVMIAIGAERFGEFLMGGRAMDEHFRHAPLEQNLPVILGMLGVWYRNFWNYSTHAILPYDQYLHRLPAHLQQLDMESNGKFVNRDGERVDYQTGAVIWGEPGTNGQHAFFQLIHQGTQIVPADFLMALRTHNPIGAHHKVLFANFLAQTQALAFGKTREEVREDLGIVENADSGQARMALVVESKIFEGNRPTNSVVFKQLDPYTLGALLAMYEHKVFVQGIVWGINSYDQMGVELGKVLAKKIEQKLDGGEGTFDSSTNGLLECYQRMMA